MNTQIGGAKGFTLVELIMALAVGVIVVAAIWTAVVAGQRSSTGIERKVTTNQDTRTALEIMATEIRMASYNPNLVETMWLNPANCNMAVNTTYKGIQEASADAITIEMDSNNDNNCSGPNEIIRYAYVANANMITRETINCSTGVPNSSGAQPFLGPIAGARTVEVVNTTGGVPFLRYFNNAGQEIPAASLPTDIPQIRRIEIALLVRSEDVDPTTGQPRRVAYSTSVVPRNHGIIFKR